MNQSVVVGGKVCQVARFGNKALSEWPPLEPSYNGPLVELAKEVQFLTAALFMAYTNMDVNKVVSEYVMSFGLTA